MLLLLCQNYLHTKFETFFYVELFLFLEATACLFLNYRKDKILTFI